MHANIDRRGDGSDRGPRRAARQDVNLTRHPGKIAPGTATKWHRLVVFLDPRTTGNAAAAALMTLYRTAFLAEGAPSGAHLYQRQMGNHHVFYFSPEAARICARIFEIFPADPCEEPRNLYLYSPVYTELPEKLRWVHFYD